jgi:hypothetical protein
MPPVEDQGPIAVQMATLIESVANLGLGLADVKRSIEKGSGLPVEIERLRSSVEVATLQVNKLFELSDNARTELQGVLQDVAIVKARHKWIASILAASVLLVVFGLERMSHQSDQSADWQHSQDKSTTALEQRVTILELQVNRPVIEKSFSPDDRK